VRADLDYEATTDVLFAPVYYRLMYGHQPLTDGLPAQIMAVCWAGIAAADDAIQSASSPATRT
jgi:hypothetical protein